MKRSVTLDRLLEVASDQAGYLTTAQAARLGVDRVRLAELAEGGDLRRVRRGVYATRGTSHPFEQEIAAWLWLERARHPWEWDGERPDAVVSHRSAAGLWDLGTFVPELPSLTVRGHLSRGRELQLHTAALGDEDWTWRRLEPGIGLPLTTPGRTIVDLALAGEEGSHLERAVHEGVERGLLSAGTLLGAAERRPRGGPALDALLLRVLAPGA